MEAFRVTANSTVVVPSELVNTNFACDTQTPARGHFPAANTERFFFQKFSFLSIFVGGLKLGLTIASLNIF